jgi:predicted permease
MTALFSLVLPIFALIGVGWLARRLELLGPHSAHELNRFIVFLGRPALLFQIIAKSTWTEHDLPGFAAAFGLGCGLIFAITVIGRRVQGSPLADASLDGLSARFLTLLSSTAAPCALVAVGVFIAETCRCLKWPRVAPLVALKLAGQPALTWLSGRYVFHLQPTMTGIAVVLASLPTGAGPLALANLYHRDATVTAGSILISTVVSLATISLLLTVFTT